MKIGENEGPVPQGSYVRPQVQGRRSNNRTGGGDVRRRVLVSIMTLYTLFFIRIKSIRILRLKIAKI